MNCGPDVADLFCSSDDEDIQMAKAICFGCPTREQCLSENYLLVGCTVAGLSWHERISQIDRGVAPEAVYAHLGGCAGKWNGREILLYDLCLPETVVQTLATN